MSKVEELRDKVMENCGVVNPWYGDPKAMAVDSLIAASRAEGMAAERGRIRKAAKFTFDQAGRGTWHVDASLLAPDKESEK